MPELPEVQTVISDLNEKIKGDTVVSFWSDWPSAIKNKKLADFQKEIASRKILAARRIGKNIFIDLSGGKTLYIHLKMTGHLLVKPLTPQLPLPLAGEGGLAKRGRVRGYFDDKVNQYIHHIWKLKSEKTLEFSDVRKFAKIVLDDSEKIKNLKEIKSLGVDAMSPDFTLVKFQEMLKQKAKTKIGIILMDQNIVAGIGNIYKSEILFEAGILPERLSGKIKKEEIKKLYQAILRILKKAIKMRGTSDSDYRDTSGAPGNFQKALKVYRKASKNCPKCGIIIKRYNLGQRSVFVCPKCQK